MRQISHHIPGLGTILGEFHSESEVLLAALDPREIHRFRETPQLGIVPMAWEGARHTRWDYVLLCSHIIRIAKSTTTVPLTSKVRLGDKTQISSSTELIQCWLLLLQLGHFHQTFSSERVFLRELSASHARGERHLSDLLNLLPEVRRSWASDVVAGSRSYDAHKVIAFARVNRLPASVEDRRFWQNLLVEYTADGGGVGKTRSKLLLKRIRRLAFLFLDAENTPTALGVKLSHILNSPTDLERLLLWDDDRGPDELRDLERYLNRRVYLAKPVLEAEARSHDPLQERFRRQLRSNGIVGAVEHLSRRDSSAGRKDYDLTAICRIEIEAGDFSVLRRSPFAPEAEISRMKNWVHSTGRRQYVSYREDATGNLRVFQVHAPCDDFEAAVAATCFAVDFVESIPAEFGLVSGIFCEGLLSQIVERTTSPEIVKTIVDLLFPNNLTWTWDKSFSRQHCISGTPKQISDAGKDLADSCDDPATRWEIEAILQEVQAINPSFSVAALPGLTAKDGRNHHAEIDGLLVWHDKTKGRLAVAILEAKNQQSGGQAAATNDLGRLTSKIAAKPGMTRSRILLRGQARKTYAVRRIYLRY